MPIICEVSIHFAYYAAIQKYLRWRVVFDVLSSHLVNK